MSAVLEMPSPVIGGVIDGEAPVIERLSRRDPRRAAHLKAHQFQVGHERIVGSGRVTGTPNAQTVYLDSLPIKAKQWVKSQAPAVLIDARKIALPIESDKSGSVAEAQPVLAFLVQHLTLVQAMPSTLQTALSDAVTLPIPAVLPTLTLSPATEPSKHV